MFSWGGAVLNRPSPLYFNNAASLQGRGISDSASTAQFVKSSARPTTTVCNIYKRLRHKQPRFDRIAGIPLRLRLWHPLCFMFLR